MGNILTVRFAKFQNFIFIFVENYLIVQLKLSYKQFISRITEKR